MFSFVSTIKSPTQQYLTDVGRNGFLVWLAELFCILFAGAGLHRDGLDRTCNADEMQYRGQFLYLVPSALNSQLRSAILQILCQFCRPKLLTHGVAIRLVTENYEFRRLTLSTANVFQKPKLLFALAKLGHWPPFHILCPKSEYARAVNRCGRQAGTTFDH
jgi:hypothetical protein